jgi:hypothetical protein
MWYFQSRTINKPVAITIDNITHSQSIFNDSTALSSLGIKPMRIVTADSRYYWNGAYTIDATGDEVVGTYAGTARDVDTLKAGMLSKANSVVASRHNTIDWYWTRAAKGGTAVPSNIATYATALYSEHETIKTAINAISDLAGVMAYENKPHTETRKVKHTAEDFTETYGPETTTATRNIDMCTHFTANPTDTVDPSFVSLVAD